MTSQPKHRPGAATGDGVRHPWARSDRPIPRRIVQPLQALLEQEASSGVLLVAAALVALAWANAWPVSYRSFWSTPLSLRVADASIDETLRGWVNDGLMSLFFLVVALEIKRELVSGGLRDLRAAALPLFGAIGGMVLPALLFLALNRSGPASSGWGVAMPTDIAFALGVLSLAAPRAPTSVKTFLLTLAIVDDLGTIVAIAIFYQRGVSWMSLLVATGIVVTWIVVQHVHVRATGLYVALGLALWIAIDRASLSPTLAGVVVGFLVPARSFQRPAAVSAEAKRIADRTVDEPEPPDADAPEWLELAGLARDAVPALARAERALIPWATWLALPMFALANAGVDLRGGALGDAPTHPVTLGLLVARIFGKPVGIVGGAALGSAVGLARRPADLRWGVLAAVASAAAVPFAVSLFVAHLAFADAALVQVTSTAVLLTAAAAGAVAFIVLRLATGGGRRDGARGEGAAAPPPTYTRRS